MKSKVITYTLIALLIAFIIYASFKLFVEPTVERRVYQEPIIYDKVEKVDNKDVSVNYDQGDVLDIKLTYGNIYEKVIKIDNNNDDDIIYSINYYDSNVSNNDVYYDAYISNNDEEYKKIIDDRVLPSNSSLIYNLIINKHSSSRIKIVFKSKHENEETSIKGKLKVTDNITSLELFNMCIKNVNDSVNKKIDKLNGIYEKGYYIINISELDFDNEASLNGYVLIDASDIAILKYIYTIYNDKYMIVNNDYNNLIIVNYDSLVIDNINEQQVCYQYDSRITCTTNIPKSSTNKKREFYNQSIELINTFKNEFDKNDDKVYIYDINKDLSKNYSLYGYILKDKDNMFLYIRNDLFMIAGYNYTKLGEYDIKTSTIRSYVDSAFELSAKDKLTVCNFSGYDECYDKDNNRIGSE